MNLIFKVIFLLIVIAVCIALCHVVYYWATYIDETITSGEGYGFKIGETKEQVYHKAAELFQDTKIFFLNPYIDVRNFGPHKKTTFTKEDYQLIEDRNEWVFYFTEGFFDHIDFKFKDDRLIEIHRRRQGFELP